MRHKRGVKRRSQLMGGPRPDGRGRDFSGGIKMLSRLFFLALKAGQTIFGSLWEPGGWHDVIGRTFQ